jgi:3-dehydroquinate synthase
LLVKSRLKTYEVNFIDDCVGYISKNIYDVLIVDKNVLELYPKFENQKIFTIISEEQNKNIDGVVKILEFLNENNIKKNSLVGVVGGGIVQDICTLALSIYMRGLRWHFYPTTLQAMIDSCIGGKSSINFQHQKNLIGNYFPPDEIIIDHNFLKTLKEIELVSGLIEGVKIISTMGENSLDDYGSKILEVLKKYENDQDASSFGEIIKEALEVKKKIIETDEFDESKRRVLNFGHTFGHVFESISDFRINHGLAVGLGILSAINFKNYVFNEQSSNFDKNLQGIILRLITPYKNKFEFDFDYDLVSKFINKDKKSESQSLTFVLPKNNGLELFKMSNGPETINSVIKAMQLTLETVKYA